MEFLKQNINGYEMLIYKNEFISDQIIEYNKFYEQHSFEHFNSFIPFVGTFLDIGANIGNHALMFNYFRPKVNIECFEPHFLNYQVLKYNTKPFKNINTFNVALNQTVGLTSIGIEPLEKNNMGNIVIDPNGDKVIQVSIDSLNISDVSFIKVDVEGLEIQVLKGGELTINKYKPVIWLEDMDYQTNKQSTLYKFINYFPDYKVLSTRGRNVILGSISNF
jgi:FkbM family methyltransferase